MLKISTLPARLAAALSASLLAICLVVVTAGTAHASFCGGTAYAPPGTAFGPISKGSAARAGYDAVPPKRPSQVHYTWEVQGNVDAPVVVQILGHDKDGRQLWIGTGVTNGSGSGTAPWGNIVGYPAIRATTASITGAEIAWTCGG